jgi:hypothetical protein
VRHCFLLDGLPCLDEGYSRHAAQLIPEEVADRGLQHLIKRRPGMSNSA